MHTEIAILSPDTLLEEALPILKENMGFLPVQKDEKLVGVIDLENIVKFLVIRQIRMKKPLPINTTDSFVSSESTGKREVLV